MSPEHSIRNSDAVLADLQAFNVDRIKTDAPACSKAELNALIAGSGLASRRVSGALSASRKGVADVAARAKAAEAVGLKVPAANENQAETPEEMEMDDDTGRTPERVEQVRAEIRRRLGVVEGARESKSLDGAGAVEAGDALLDGVAGAASAGAASDSPV
ncbi:hypothetical protein [Caulobacter sp. UNC358MFTsu5.1]|uniref:hypothetical protein n=1 Tax=Caulobacter sp. UNC358MFTsu5.1 TaxID=1449049 RepID=UPI001E409019|nr:hypothetical protein [Caulobacter sp. UNC358MFTsu5.1]